MNVAYSPKSGYANVLLMDVARKIQLPSGAYRTAQERYGVMCEWLRRPESELRSMITRLYGQGSVAIGAVISSKFDSDEFDVDAIVELGINRHAPPGAVLDALHRAIAGEPGSRYYGKTRRHSRCITVQYDEMHIDFTPAVLAPEQLARTSIIFHANEKEDASRHYHKDANPWGFADWFKEMMPESLAFDEAILRKSVTEPLPDQDDLNEKSLPLLSLQLLKRWRNKCYDMRAGRMPPSVMLAFFAAKTPGRRYTLLEELSAQAEFLRKIIWEQCARGRLLRVTNPRCEQDVLTDRWPADMTEQVVFMHDLEDLVNELANLAGAPTMADCQRILGKLFGERATTEVIGDFAKRHSASASAGEMHHHLKTGAIALGASGLASRSYGKEPIAPTPPHRNFGSDPN